MGLIRIGSLGIGNDVGALKPIPEGETYAGSYKVSVGGLGVVNSEGHYFPATQDVLSVFNTSSALMRRVEKQVLKGEAEHPTKLPNETKESFAYRFMNIDTKNTAFLIRSIEVGDPVNVPGQTGKVHPIFLYIDPIGAHGDALRSDLENPNSNTYFSIRCLSKRGTNERGQVTRTIYHVVTWDWVNEGGVNFADKKTSIAMNNLTSESYVEMEIEQLIDLVEDDDLTTESACNVPTKEMLQSLDAKSFSDIWLKD